MKKFISLSDLTKENVFEIFAITDELMAGKYQDVLKGKTVVMFFSNSSIRTRVTFEKGIRSLGGEPILFPTDTLDKKEDIRDVCGYLNNWADMIIVRHKSMELIETIANYSKIPVINAMTAINHPCEMMSDMYALSKRRKDFTKDKYLFCGAAGNIGLAWKEASQLMEFPLEQCCGHGYEMQGIHTYYDIKEAIQNKDIICTDSLPAKMLPDFVDCQVTKEVMDLANPGALLNPCPPFYRGEEVTEDAIASEYFVGYEFKKCLLEVQQAIMVYCLQ